MIKFLPLVLLLTGCGKSDLPDPPAAPSDDTTDGTADETSETSELTDSDEPTDTDEPVDTDVPDTDTDTGTDSVTDPDADSDGDGLSNALEAELGTDPDEADSDGDGVDDGDEVDCVSDPLDGDEQCYACGWEHNADESWSSEGSEIGDTIANVALVDTCGEAVDLWDLAGEYHILYLTGAW